jgi:signal transduction histidine kinase
MQAQSGQALAATQIATDATREAIAQAARAQRDELLVLASHDMKNAVGILDSALGMIEEMPEQTAMMQGMMRRATHRLGILVRALVDVDCLERGVMPLVPTELRWSAIIAPTIDQALPVGQTKEIAIVPRGDQHARLWCDAGLVERILTALVDHAIGNAPTKSVVDVDGTRIGEGRFRIRIVATGRPVPAGALEQYFTTLPLRFCRLAALRHGATLRAQSPVDDHGGMAFEIELPG